MIHILQNGATPRLLAWTGAYNSVASLLQQNGVSFAAPCGGLGKCGKCRVRLSGDVSAPSEKERALLTKHELQSGVRLACQARVTGENAVIELPEAVGMAGVTNGVETTGDLRPLGKALGLAVDIGTTTVAAYLYDLSSGARLGTTLAENPQRAFGADVISRLTYAAGNGARQLQSCVCGCIDSLAKTLCAGCGRTTDEIDAAVLTGNTAMLYFLTGRVGRDLAAFPFEAEERFGNDVEAGSLTLRFSPGCRVHLPRCISAYIGADITCAILSADLTTRTGTALLADIGTNGELVLHSGSRLLCCSTAAGPAFEGAGLSCGSCALPGAVDAVWRAEEQLEFRTIGSKQPVSLCGSGALDLLACLRESGVVDDSGYLESDESRNELAAFSLTEDVFFTQKDVRALQLAKAALRAGMETLTRHGELEAGADALLLAGGFGNRLRVESALKIGLFPAWAQGRIVPLGNAAGMGAVRLLLDEGNIAASQAVAASAETLDLATDPIFTEEFVERMSFEEEEA